jgi:hypothetical protein
MLNKEFSFKRVAKIIGNDLYIRRWQFALTAGVVLVWFWTMSLLSWSKHKSGDLPFGYFYLLSLYFCGTAFTFGVFRDISTLKDGVLLITQPALRVEKFIAKFIWSGVGFVIVFNVFWVFASAGIATITNLSFGYKLPVIPKIPLKIVHEITVYTLLHSIAFAGAALFRKKSLILTLLGFGMGWLIVAVVCSIMDRESISVYFMSIRFAENVAFSWNTFKKVNIIDTVMIYGLMMPLLWIAAYQFFKARKV